MKLVALTARGCAWHAVHVALVDADGRERVALHVGIDPTFAPGRPRLFGGVHVAHLGTLAVGDRNRSRGTSRTFSVTVPAVSWGFAWRTRFVGGLLAYRLSSRFWNGLDGRYGWWRSGGAS